MLISTIASRHVRNTTFFDRDRKSPWFLVAFRMVGSGISAVSLVSIPGNVGNNNLYYLQFILGTIVGYLFYCFRSYTYILQTETGFKIYLSQYPFRNTTYKTGSLFFWSHSHLSRPSSSSFNKDFTACLFDALHIPYFVTIIVVLIPIWLYTNKSGIKQLCGRTLFNRYFLFP
ncbi:MAG: hypothetical protein IPJ16_08735 [Bacteroidales bacterium]|nr:hypothetical protein [Bacteroidales bacterium]